jgi:prepilin-type N-terminal cleavage/methylation domain-containing protein
MKSSILAGNRRGFTLIETVVTVGLIAVLAAFVIPTVVQKADAADPVKVQNDVAAIASAAGTFFTDAKGVYPAEVKALTAKINTASLRLDGTTFDTTRVLTWNGPYLTLTIEPVTDAFQTGFGLLISNDLADYDAQTNVAKDVGGSTLLGSTGSWLAEHPRFLAVQVGAVPRQQALEINRLIDGVTEDASDSTQAQPGGRFRFTKVTAGKVNAYFLGSPITP